MGEKSSIQWTHASWNPWTGCRKVSSGCKFCYMMRDKEKYGKNGEVILKSKTTFNDPLKWKEHKLIFTSSWTDIFIEEGDQWRDEIWAIIKKCPQHIFQILTKRPERINDHLPKDWGENGFGYPNVWIGVSVENQKAYDIRVPLLMKVPARVRFLSCEPLLAKIDLTQYINSIDWVIVGGESGNDTGKWLYRPCEINWIEKIITQCAKSDVPVFMKQMGTEISKSAGYKERHGGDLDEWPEQFKIREFPKSYKA